MVRHISRAVLLLVAALALACCGGAPATVSTPAREPDSGATSEPEHRSPTRPTPSRLDIPAIGLSTSMITLGLNEDGTVEVPKDPARAGWFDLGTVPGQPGSAVILGHVDSAEGPAVFADLATLRAGDRITIGLSDSTTVTFEVQRVATYANADFPAQHVYAGTPDRPGLNLVTCGGEYDADRGGYQANVVVFTQRVES